MMLKEGWDVQNVTTIIGLRAFGGGEGSNILPEQTLGRGLRRMYREKDVPEFVSVVGTNAFMDFVESIKSEGVELDRKAMGEGTKPKSPIVVEIDKENTKKDIDKLDIEIPVLTPRIHREYKNISELDVTKFDHKKVKIIQFSDEQQREIVFRQVVLKDSETEHAVHHKTVLDSSTVIDYQSVIGHFTQIIMKELRLVSGYDLLYPKVKEFIKFHLFETQVNIEDINVLRNLS